MSDAFDPDAFLQSAPPPSGGGEFDPDAFLKGTTATMPAVPTSPLDKEISEWAKHGRAAPGERASMFGTPLPERPKSYLETWQQFHDEAQRRMAEGAENVVKASEPGKGIGETLKAPFKTVGGLYDIGAGAVQRTIAPLTAAGRHFGTAAQEYYTGIPAEKVEEALGAVGPAKTVPIRDFPVTGEPATRMPLPSKTEAPPISLPGTLQKAPLTDLGELEKSLYVDAITKPETGDLNAARVSPIDKASEFGIPLSRGQAEQDMEAIRYEDLASRGAHGKPAQEIATPWFQNQFEKIGEAGQGIGERLAGEQPIAANPSEAAATINAEIASRAEQARNARGVAQQEAQDEAMSQYRMAGDQARVIEEALRRGHLPIENARETGEVVSHDVRAQAAADRDHYRNLYNEAFALPGEFHAGAFEGIGERIQGDLSRGDNPVIIDDVTTPVASKAIRDLENISNLRIQNRAEPGGAPNPENIVGVDLRGVDQARKRLVAYYQAARSSVGGQITPDVRAMGRILDAFDNQVEHSIANGLFSGDERALGALQDARAAYRRYAQTYRPRQAGDDVGAAIRRIVDRQATPEETANMILGSGRLGNAGLPVRLVDRLETILGENSDGWSTIRQAMWQRASQVRNAAGEIEPVKSSANIEQFAGSSLGQRIFEPYELAAMRDHARAIRQLDRTIELLPETEAAAHAARGYETMFSGEGIGGAQQAVFRRIVEGVATPEETSNAVFGAIGSGNPGNAARMIDAIERIVGSPSETMSALRQGVWQRVTQAPAGKDQPGAQKLAQNINEFLNGRGKTIAEKLYTPEERDLMQRYADVVKQTVIPKYARTNSDTAPVVAGMVRRAAFQVMSAISGHGLVGRLAHAGVERLIASTAERLSDAAEARKVAESLNYSGKPKPSAASQGGLDTEDVGRQPLKRNVLKRSSSGRPMQTAPLKMGRENDVLEDGHDRVIKSTIPKPDEMKEVRGPISSDPKFVYHATSAERIHDIATDGLKLHGPSEFTDQYTWPDGSRQKRNYFTPTAHNTWQFAPEEGKPVLLRMERDAHPIKKEQTGDLYSTKTVPSSKLEVLSNDGTWIPLNRKIVSQKYASGGAVLPMSTRKESNYSPSRGIAGRHCGPDKGWPEGYCSKYIKPNKCREVAGFIAARGGCDWYVAKPANRADGGPVNDQTDIDPQGLLPADYQSPGAAASGLIGRTLANTAYDTFAQPLVSLGKLGTGQSDTPASDLGYAAGAIGLPGKMLLAKGLAAVAGTAAPKVLGELAAKPAAEAVESGIKAYHGSPHDFDRFDVSKIGTGEGAQAYGHGLYFAERPGVAESYKTTLSSAIIDKKSADQYLQDTPKIDTVYDAIRHLKEQGQTPTIEDAAKFMNKSPIPAERRVAEAIKTYGRLDNARRMMNKTDVPIFDRMVKDGRIEVNPGRMYEVAIKAHPDEFLDWDKPIPPEVAAKLGIEPQGKPMPYGELRDRFVKPMAEITKGTDLERAINPENVFHGKVDVPAVREYLRAEHPEKLKAFDALMQQHQEATALTGKDVVHHLSEIYPDQIGGLTSSEGSYWATQKMREAGIPGIKYLDQGSRWTGDPVNVIQNRLDKAQRTLAEAKQEGRAPSVDYWQKEVDAHKTALEKASRPQTRNYVVFHHDLVDILKKYGIAGIGALPALGAYHFKDGDIPPQKFADGGSVCDNGTTNPEEQSEAEWRGNPPVGIGEPGLIERASGGRVMAHYVDQNPTEAQREAGNYKKAHTRLHSLDITIENPKGTWRQGNGPDGHWKVQLPFHYGYLLKSQSADGDHVDVAIGPHPQSKKIFVIDQHDAKTGEYDEVKCIMGCGSASQARSLYLKSFSDGKGSKRLGHMEEMTIDRFKDFLKNYDTTKPLKPAEEALPKIDHSHDVRWLSELDKSGETIFYDRSSPRRIINNGKPLDPVQPLIRHEMAEFKAMKEALEKFKEKHGREPDDAEREDFYRLAHRDHGNIAERDWLVANGFSIKAWNVWCRQQLARLEKKKAPHPPQNADVRPVAHDRGDLEFTDA